MRDERKVWELMGETTASIFPLARDITGPLFEKYFTEQRFYPITFTAAQIAPRSITADLLNKRTPYANPAGAESLLADTTEAGYLDADGKGGYVVSEKGATAIHDVHEAFYNHINKVNRFPADKLKELDALLDKLVEACAKADFPNGVLCLDISHNGHPTVEPASLAKIDQHLDDMNAFRDDAHITAWMPVGVDGHTWEVFGFVWNGEATTAEKLLEVRPFRGYTVEDYANTLDALTQRGWIKPGDDGYKIMDAGKKIRDEAEVATDNNYFAPWKVLTDKEVTRLGELLSELKEINLKITEENQAK